MEKYLINTRLLNYKSHEISDLVSTRKWRDLAEFDKIGAIYDFIQNEIPLGYNNSIILR